MLREDQIGRRIRKLRLDRGLSLRQLAMEAGITASYLSKIENSDSAPPVSTLVSLAHAFGVTIDALFSEQVTESVYTIVKKTQRQTIPRQGTRFGYSSYVPLARKFPGRYMEPILLTVPPELKTPKQFQHVGQEFLFVLKGKLRFKIGTEELIMKEGDAVYFDASVPHAGASADGKPSVCLMVIYSGTPPQRSRGAGLTSTKRRNKHARNH